MPVRLADVAGSAVAGRQRVPAQTLSDRDGHQLDYRFGFWWPSRSVKRPSVAGSLGAGGAEDSVFPSAPPRSQVTRHRPTPLQHSVAFSGVLRPSLVMTLLPAFRWLSDAL